MSISDLKLCKARERQVPGLDRARRFAEAVGARWVLPNSGPPAFLDDDLFEINDFGQEGNVFMLRAELLEPPQDWWRPGMSGVAKVEAGDRRIIWLLTHRLVDYLRLKLWL